MNFTTQRSQWECFFRLRHFNGDPRLHFARGGGVFVWAPMPVNPGATLGITAQAAYKGMQKTLSRIS